MTPNRMAVAGATGVALVAGVLGPAPSSAAVPDSRPIVVLLGDHVARTAPQAHAPRLMTVPGRRPLTGVRTVLPQLARRGREWSRVLLPGRPNSTVGWIRTGRTRSRSTGWRIVVRLRSRTVVVRRFGAVVRRFGAVVGKRSTPTPRGRFFIEEAVALGPGAAGGPFALATSARSDVLQEFAGGPGQIAIHGRNFLPDPLGSAASHGCVRTGTRAITWLSRRIGAGVPLRIVR